jgi:hypothetical protein
MNLFTARIWIAILVMMPLVALLAQAPSQFRFQAVGRDVNGNLIANTPLQVRFAVRTGSENGPVAYREQHNVITDEFGHFNANVGGGSVLTGTFDQIPWSSASHFLQIEYNDGSGFKDLGAASLMSVPYALYANQSGFASAASLNIRLNPALSGKGTNEEPLDLARQGASSGQVLKWNGLSWTPADDLNSDSQILVLNGNALSISGGNTINLPAQIQYQAGSGIDITGNTIQNTGDLSATNELQVLSKAGNSITLSQGGGSITDEVNDADADPTNEIQQINRVGPVISLSQGGGQVDLSDLGSKWQLSGQNAFRIPGNIGLGVSNPLNKLHILGDVFVENTQTGALRLGQGNDGNQWWLGTANDATDFELGHKPSAGALSSRLSVKANGNVGIGNQNPNARMVIGTNLNQNRTYPALTVGNAEGGAVQLGNDENALSLESGLATPLSRMTLDGPLGAGRGDLSIQARGVNIGVQHDQSPYKLKVAHETFGFALENANTEKNWEMYVNETLNGLDLFYDGTYKGTFDAVTGGYFSTSDTTLKFQLTPVESISEKINQIVLYRFQYKGAGAGQEQLGVSAQEVHQYFPELTRRQRTKTGEEVLTVNYAALSALALKAVQEQSRKLGDLESRLDEQEKLIKELLMEMEKLKKD